MKGSYLEDGDQGGECEKYEGKSNSCWGERQLACDWGASGQLGEHSGDEANHGKTTVGDLGGCALEGHSLGEAQSCKVEKQGVRADLYMCNRFNWTNSTDS